MVAARETVLRPEILRVSMGQVHGFGVVVPGAHWRSHQQHSPVHSVLWGCSWAVRLESDYHLEKYLQQHLFCTDLESVPFPKCIPGVIVYILWHLWDGHRETDVLRRINFYMKIKKLLQWSMSYLCLGIPECASLMVWKHARWPEAHWNCDKQGFSTCCSVTH